MSKGNRTTGSRYTTKLKKAWFGLKAEDMKAGRVVTKYSRLSFNINSLDDLKQIESVAEASIIDLVFADVADKEVAMLELLSNKKHIFNYLMQKID